MPFVTLRDGAQLFYKDWGNKTAQTVVFSHGWPLSADNWDAQMFFLANKGYRVVAHDRRGHGRSEQTWERNDVDNWADDLAEVINHLDLKDIMLVGHSTGGGEIARYCTRHSTSRVKKIVFIAANVPQYIQTPNNPEGVPITVTDGFRAAMEKDRGQFFIDVPTGPFFGYNRPGVKSSQGFIDGWYQQGMQAGIKAVYETTRSWEVDFSEDLKKLEIPAFVIQGDDDQVVPIKAGALAAIKLLKDGKIKVYPGGSHALPNTNAEEINDDLLQFLNA